MRLNWDGNWKCNRVMKSGVGKGNEWNGGGNHENGEDLSECLNVGVLYGLLNSR